MREQLELFRRERHVLAAACERAGLGIQHAHAELERGRRRLALGFEPALFVFTGFRAGIALAGVLNGKVQLGLTSSVRQQHE